MDPAAGGNLPLAFSGFNGRVELRGPGQFSYHPGKHDPRVVRQIEDGYQLAFAGQQVIDAPFRRFDRAVR
jgi:hypothetical protein